MLPVLFPHLKDTNFHMDKTSNQQDFSLRMEDLLIRCAEKDKRGYDIVFLYKSKQVTVASEAAHGKKRQKAWASFSLRAVLEPAKLCYSVWF